MVTRRELIRRAIFVSIGATTVFCKFDSLNAVVPSPQDEKPKWKVIVRGIFGPGSIEVVMLDD